MELTTSIKQRVIGEMMKQRQNFEGSDSKYATSLGINKAVYARLKKGETERVLAEHKWISLARKLQVQLDGGSAIKIAQIPVYTYITKQLEYCQKNSCAGIFCDLADIGKTVTAKHYAQSNKNVVYVDCSQVKTKQKLVRYIARQFGLDSNGKYADVYEDLVYYLKAITTPLVILDEAGDLDYAAWLELKALWNATEDACGWYMIGADGLETKIRRFIGCRKVGYTEIFRRFGSRFQHIVPSGLEERKQFLDMQAAMIIKLNEPSAKVQELIAKCNRRDDHAQTGASLTRVVIEIKKLKRAS